MSLWPQDTTLYTQQQQQHRKTFIAPSLGTAPTCLPGQWDTNTLKNPTGVSAELLSNSDCKTTQKGVKSPLTTSPVNSQKWLVRGNAFVVSDRWKSLRQGNDSLWPGREAEQTSRMWRSRIGILPTGCTGSGSAIPSGLIYPSQDRGEAV